MTDYLTSETPPRIVSTGTAFSVGSVHYGAEWLSFATPQQLFDAGLRTINYLGSPGDPHYFSVSQSAPVVTGNVASITWINTPRAANVCVVSKLQDLNLYALNRDSLGTTFGGFPVFTTDHYKILYAIYNQRAAAGTQTTFNLPDGIGAFHTLTSVQMQGLYSNVAAYVAGVLAVQDTHATNISALADANLVIAYDYTTGWPV